MECVGSFSRIIDKKLEKIIHCILLDYNSYIFNIYDYKFINDYEFGTNDNEFETNDNEQFSYRCLLQKNNINIVEFGIRFIIPDDALFVKSIIYQKIHHDLFYNQFLIYSKLFH